MDSNLGLINKPLVNFYEGLLGPKSDIENLLPECKINLTFLKP